MVLPVNNTREERCDTSVWFSSMDDVGIASRELVHEVESDSMEG